MKEDNIANMDAVSYSEEQIEKLGFEPTQAESDYVDAMATTVQSDMKGKRSFEGQRNRDSWKRMNRPSKQAKIDKGSTLIHTLLDRFKVA